MTEKCAFVSFPQPNDKLIKAQDSVIPAQAGIQKGHTKTIKESQK
jgi:hypothetical protein